MVARKGADYSAKTGAYQLDDRRYLRNGAYTNEGAEQMTGTHTKPTLTHEEAKQAVFQYLREVEGLGLPKENIEAGINAILRLAGIADVYPAAK